MTRKDKEAVVAVLEEYKGDCTGVIAATIEDCQRVVREMAEDSVWIPVTERLPELHIESYEEPNGDMMQYEASDVVWVVTASNNQTKAQYESGPLFRGWVDEYGATVRTIYWAPLPELPKEAGQYAEKS